MDVLIGADGGGTRGAWRERKSTGGGRDGRNKIAPRHVEREACRILSDGIRLCFSWHLGIPISRAERKVVAIEFNYDLEISDRLVSDRGRPMTSTRLHHWPACAEGNERGPHCTCPQWDQNR
jgi:hypothetical protein